MSPEQLQEFKQIYPTTPIRELCRRYNVSTRRIYDLASQHRLKKDLEAVSNARSQAAILRYRNKNTEPAPETTDGYNPRDLVIEEITFLLSIGYRVDLAKTVKQRLGYLENNTYQWFEERMHWTLGEWIERLGSLPKGAL